MKENRRKKIESLIGLRQSISMKELCDIFGVSMNTIRADVASLVKAGAVEKVYGGIRVKEQKEIPLFAIRAQHNVEHKIGIARAAASLIENGDIVFIDAGTTAMHILDYIVPGTQITIITHSLPVIIKAYEMPNVTLEVLPGMYNRRTNSLLDGSTAEYLSYCQATKAFIGTSALSPSGSLNVSNYLEYELKRTAISRSQSPVLLVDSSKYGEAGLLSYATVEQFSLVLTDSDMPEAFLALCRGKQVPISQI